MALSSVRPTIDPDFQRSLRCIFDSFNRTYKFGPQRVGQDDLVFGNQQGQPIAFLSRRAVHGFYIYVQPRYRRQGIATRLYRFAVERCRWPLDPQQERYTPDGAAWMNGMQANG